MHHKQVSNNALKKHIKSTDAIALINSLHVCLFQAHGVNAEKSCLPSKRPASSLILLSIFTMPLN